MSERGGCLARVPVRWRLTGATVLLSAVTLAGITLVILIAFRHQLDTSIRRDLRERGRTLAGLVRTQGPGVLRQPAGRGLLRPQGAAAQVLDRRDRVLAASFNAPRRPIVRGTAGAELTGPIPGLAARAAITVLPVRPSGLHLVIGRSLGDQERADESLGRALLIGGPLVLLLVALGAYLVATRALAPVERMQRQAAEMSRAPLTGRLPVSPARDELGHLGQTLNLILDRAAEASAHERSFIADASHELRTPLTRLQAGIEVALSRRDNPAELRGALEAAGEEARRLGVLATDLLTLAALENHGRQPDRVPLDLADVLADCASSRHARAVSEGRSLRWSAPPIVLRADPAQLQIALGNLIDNALIHGAGPVRVDATKDDGWVTISVEDQGSGLGLPLDRARERFVRGPASGGRPGAGLGLALAAAIAEAHGGRLELRTGPRTTVCLVLPLTSATATSPRS